jgi:hypothetical protein
MTMLVFIIVEDIISTSIIVGTRDGFFSHCWNPLHEIPIIMQDGGEVVKVLVDMVCSVLNVVQAPIELLSFNVMFCIKDTNHECKDHQKQLLVFMLHVIMVGEIILEAISENHTKFCFLMII